MECKNSRTYERYEDMPSIMTRVLNGLADLRRSVAVNGVLRKHDMLNMYEYELRELNVGMERRVIQQIAADLWFSPRISRFELIRLQMMFATISNYNNTLIGSLSAFDYENRINGEMFGDFVIPRMIQSSLWPLHLTSGMSIDDITSLDSMLIGNEYSMLSR